MSVLWSMESGDFLWFHFIFGSSWSHYELMLTVLWEAEAEHEKIVLIGTIFYSVRRVAGLKARPTFNR